jgi:hypothetical protein
VFDDRKDLNNPDDSGNLQSLYTFFKKDV